MNQEAGSKSNDNVMAALASIPLVGLIMYFAMPDASPFVKNYARQGTILFPLGFVLGVIPIINFIGGPILLVLIVMLVVQALQGNETYRLPVVADLADRFLQ